VRPDVDVAAIQGNVVYPYRLGHALYLRLCIPPHGRAAAAAAIARLIEGVTFGRPADGRESHLNLAFTWQGLERLLGDDPALFEFPDDFRAGARARAADLGDDWPQTQRFEDADVLVTINGKTRASCARRLDEVRRICEPLTEVELCRAGLVGHDKREHFGFADGRSQPAIEGVDDNPVGDGIYAIAPSRRRAGQVLSDLGLRATPRRWRLSRAGEFLLGHYNEDGVLPAGPGGPLGPNGTYLVYRKIAQHVDVFRAYVAGEARANGLPEEVLAAKILGRWPDGAPLVNASGRGDPEVAGNRLRSNDFLYADDPHGYACPLGAHIRRANPRDGLPGGAERTMRHRIIRRGMPYRDPKANEVGLVFIGLGASIASGFEFIQREWIAGGAGLGLGSGPDFLLQTHTTKAELVVNGARTVVLEPPASPFVTVRGCEYHFVPSRQGCEWLIRRSA
jgi:Dyp-type peroxidase family